MAILILLITVHKALHIHCHILDPHLEQVGILSSQPSYYASTPLPVSSFAWFSVGLCHFFLIHGTKSENAMKVAVSFHILMRKTANWPFRPHDLHRGRHWRPWMALSEHSVSAVYPLKQSEFLLTELDSEITYCKGRRQLIKFVSGLPPGNLFSPGWFLSGPWHVLIGMTLLADAGRRQTPLSPCFSSAQHDTFHKYQIGGHKQVGTIWEMGM